MISLATQLAIVAMTATPSAYLASTEQAGATRAPLFNYDASIRDHLQRKLADPDNAKIKLLREPRWGTFVGFKMPWQDPEAGWIVCYSINAKKPDGDYTGFQTVLFIMTADGLVRSTYYEKNYRQPAGNRVTRECSER